MVRLRLSADARDDLAEIDEYGTERFGDEVAAAYSRGFSKAFAQLRVHPRSAPARKDYGAEIRCLTHYGHRILYVYHDDEVLIVRVLHHSRDVRKALDE